MLARLSLHINNGKDHEDAACLQHANNSPVTVAGQPIAEVHSFTYLGSMVDTHGGTDTDLRTRIGKA